MANTDLVINNTRLMQLVDVNQPDGTKTAVQIMAKSRVYLDAGQSVCGNWVARNPSAVRVVPAQVATPTSDASGLTPVAAAASDTSGLTVDSTVPVSNAPSSNPV